LRLGVCWAQLGEQQARLVNVTEQLVLAEDAIKAGSGELVFAALKGQHVPNFPLPAGPSRITGFRSFAAKKMSMVMTESMKYPLAASLAESSWTESNIWIAPFIVQRQR
jgi:hypothetical protein